MDKVKVGMVGVGGRGDTLTKVLAACKEAEIVAVCDLVEEKMEKIAEVLKEKGRERPAFYTDYIELLKHNGLDAVVLATSWEEHIHMAIEAMRSGIAVAVEVGGAYDIEECWQLVRVYEETKTPIFFMENCCWDRFELLSTSLARNGKLGEIVHVNGAYAHDLREHLLEHPYRLNNYIKRNCENYPTHEIGPISKLLNITRGNKFLSLVSVASKTVGMEAYINSDAVSDKSLAKQKYAQGDIVTTVIKCAGGETITLRLDTTLPRFYSREFNVHGTKGYTCQNGNLVFLDGDNAHLQCDEALREFMDSAKKYEEYLPEIWKNMTDEGRRLGHGGMDFLMMRSFLEALLAGKEMPIDVYEAATWIAITVLSEQSIAQGGQPICCPDFTRGKWVNRTSYDVTCIPKIN